MITLETRPGLEGISADPQQITRGGLRLLRDARDFVEDKGKRILMAAAVAGVVLGAGYLVQPDRADAQQLNESGPCSTDTNTHLTSCPSVPGTNSALQVVPNNSSCYYRGGSEYCMVPWATAQNNNPQNIQIIPAPNNPSTQYGYPSNYSAPPPPSPATQYGFPGYGYGTQPSFGGSPNAGGFNQNTGSESHRIVQGPGMAMTDDSWQRSYINQSWYGSPGYGFNPSYNQNLQQYMPATLGNPYGYPNTPGYPGYPGTLPPTSNPSVYCSIPGAQTVFSALGIPRNC